MKHYKIWQPKSGKCDKSFLLMLPKLISTNFLQKKYVQNKHKGNKVNEAKTVENSKHKPILSKLVPWFYL